jgi:succinyl-diaminopimelate desuccinylase
MVSTIFDAICREVEACKDELIETLVSLVRIPTQTPPGENYDRIVGFLLPEFRRLGFNARRYDLPPEIFEARCRRYYPELVGVRANLLATLNFPGRPGMAFYCHLDTVPAGDLAHWTVNPFEPVVRDGYVWGRGSADSKAGAAAILQAFRVLYRLGIEPRVSPVVALTTDEEVGPYSGLMYMADSAVFEGCEWFHSCDGMADSVGIGSLGAFTWTIRILGRSVHSGSSFLGLNPIEHSVALLDELLRTKREVEARRSSLMAGPEVVRIAGRQYLGPLLNVTIARGGIKHNIVPPEFVLEGDRRFIPEEDEAACVRELEEAIGRARQRDPDLQCELRVRPFYPAFMRPADDPWVREVCRLVSAVRGVPVGPAGVNGSTDVAHVGRVTPLKVTIHGVARHGETRNHGVDERCRVDDLIAVTKIVALLAARVWSPAG